MRGSLTIISLALFSGGTALAAPPGPSNAESLKGLQSRSASHVLATIKVLKKQVPPEKLAPILVPLMLHKEQQVRQAAGDFVGDQGWDGASAAHIAKLSFDPVNARLIPGLVRQSDKNDRLLRATATLIAKAHPKTPLGNAIDAALRHKRPAATAAKPTARRKSLLRIWRESVMLAWFGWDGTKKSGKQSRLIRNDNRARPNFAEDLTTLRRRSKDQMRPSLLARLKSSDRDTLQSALRDLQLHPALGDFHEQQIIAHLSHANTSIRRSAVAAVRSVNAPWARVESGIRRLARSKRAEVRSRAVQSLHGTRAAKNVAAQNLLFNLATSDNSSDVRRDSAHTLGSAGPAAKKHYPALLKAIAQEKNAAVQVALVQACRKLIVGKPKTQRALARLEDRLRHRELVQLARDLIRKQRDVTRRTRELQFRSVIGEGTDER